MMNAEDKIVERLFDAIHKFVKRPEAKCLIRDDIPMALIFELVSTAYMMGREDGMELQKELSK